MKAPIPPPSLPPPRTRRRLGAAGLVLAMCLSSPVHSQEVAQDFLLRPGWNAVYVEVTPAAADPAAVFDGLPIESVWTRSERVTTADFVRNQNEVEWNDSGWRVFRPTGLPGAFATSLHAIAANRAYLIHVSGSAPVPWRVVGRPSLRHPAWVPDAFNLRGFPIDPAHPPVFLDFLRPSPAHHNTVSGNLEPIYRLGADGLWREAASTDRMVPGEAVWIRCRGASTFIAPFQVRTDFGDALDFGALVSELPLRLLTLGTVEREARIVPLSEAGRTLWSVHRASLAPGDPAWAAAGTEIRRRLMPGVPTTVRLAARRGLFTQARAADVLSVTDGSGARWLVPVQAERSTDTFSTRHPGAGFWIGSARVQRVSESNLHGQAPVTPARAPFALRVLLHVDAEGHARLLHEVTQLWEEGVSETRADGVRVPVQPGRYVFFSVAAPGREFSGPTLRNGVAVGRRLSTADFDFSGYPSNALPLSGLFQPGARLEATYHLPHDAPTNPFRHAYHPDHDNLDERFSGPKAEAYAITRQLTFEPQTQDPTGFSDPDYGHAVIAGAFRETISGLHHQPLRVEGDFRLRRVSDSPVLNPQPRDRQP